MITVITNPSDHNFSRSPVICELETDNMYMSGNFGDHARFVFYFSNNPATNEEFKVDTAVFSGYFVFTNGVNPFKWTIPLKAGGLSDLDYYMNVVLLRIRANPGITSNFNVFYIGSGGFSFEAMNPGPSSSNIGSSVSGAGFSFTNLVNGTDNFLTNVPRANYKLAVDLYVSEMMSNPGNFRKIFSSEKEPMNNRVRFDLSTVINTQTEYYFPIPNQNFSNACPYTAKRFYVKLREIYGTPPVDQITYATPNSALASPGQPVTYSSIIIKAGFSPRWNKIQPIQQLDSFLWNYPLFLSTAPDNLSIKINQPEYLFYSFPDDCMNPALRILTTFRNGTTAVAYDSAYTGILAKGFIGCFPVSASGSVIYYHLLSGNALKFDVGIVSMDDPTTYVSSHKTYVANYESVKEDKIFLFTNSMGGVDTFRSEGDFDQDTLFEKEVSNRQYYPSDAWHLGSEDHSQHEKTDAIKVYSGFIEKSRVSWFEEIYLSKYIVEVVDSVIYQPITITSTKIRTHASKQNLVAFEMEYYYQLKSPVTDRLAAAL